MTSAAPGSLRGLVDQLCTTNDSCIAPRLFLLPSPLGRAWLDFQDELIRWPLLLLLPASVVPLVPLRTAVPIIRLAPIALLP